MITPLLPASLLQSVFAAFVPLCEAVVSWRAMSCEGLRNELTQLLQVGGKARCASRQRRRVQRNAAAMQVCRRGVACTAQSFEHRGALLSHVSQGLKVHEGAAEHGRVGGGPQCPHTQLVPCSADPALSRGSPLQGLKAQLSSMGQWEAALGSLSPAVQQKLRAEFQL